METVGSRRGAFIVVSPEEARHAIASAFLTSGPQAEGGNAEPKYLLGSIELKPHQIEAIARLRSAISEFGGALLGDPVGTGKTFCALTLAASYRRPLVVAPAVLKQMWERASAEALVPVRFVSHEWLSHHPSHHHDCDFLIVDEAHHARNAATKRFSALSRIAAGRDVILLSATPIHNRRADLDTLLSLFLGDRARTLSNAEFGRCVVRREPIAREAFGIPQIERLQWREMAADDSVLEALMALPPPLPPRDGGDGGSLIAHSLVRQWASSDAALRGALVRRKNRAIALISALESGTYPSRAELGAWCGDESAVQLAFAELVASPIAETNCLLATIRAHCDGVARVLDRVARESQRDDARANIIRGLRASHPGASVLVFSQYEDTVTAMFRRLSCDGGVAALAGGGGRVAGGRISRREAIGRFAPAASERNAPRRSEVVTMLITTDLLSEGVNLQDASVVVHLDLPWTPARMEQRLGRIARIGSRHRRVHSYAIRPPASAEAVIGIEAILAAKVRSASLVIERFPSLAGDHVDLDAPRNEPRVMEELRQRLSQWLNHDASESSRGDSNIRVACVAASSSGFLAACAHAGRRIVIGSVEQRISDDPRLLLHCIQLADGDGQPVNQVVAESALFATRAYFDAALALDDVRPAAQRSSSTKRLVLRRIATAVQHARPHARPRIVALARKARSAVLARLGAHLERGLGSLLSAHLPDEAWLEAVITRSSDARFTTTKNQSASHEILAVVLFGCDDQVNALSRAKES